RISFGGKSHQPFRSVYYFLGRAAQDRLDGNGRILSASSARFSFASGRCVPGGSISRGSQNHPHCHRTAETGPNWRAFSRGGHPLRRVSAMAIDSLMCASLNLMQSRHRLRARSRDEMERYVAECEKLTAHDFYAVPHDGGLASGIGEGAMATWRSPITTKFP